jgi:predicted short-subunit dehydrogenase-like oxidoreductase (DUF2520 family)
MRDRTIAIIGAGTVGTAVGATLQSRGYKIAAVAAKSQASLDRAASYLDAHATNDIAEAAGLGDLIFITTSDDSIKDACDDIGARGGFSVDDIVFHMSGALPLSALAAAERYGAKTGCIHPMQTFATVDSAIERLPGSVFGVTADDEALTTADEIIDALGSEKVMVKDEDKAIYHAAACVVSNYLVSLVHLGEGLYGEIGIEKEMARKAFLPLLKGTVVNIANYGPAEALTGPIARGDIGTIARHLEALQRTAPWALPAYREMGLYTVRVAVEKGTVDENTAIELTRLLETPDADV